MAFPLKNILVTGGSSGIGRAVAVEFARRGAERIFICGRDSARLEEAAEECRRAGASASAAVADVADAARMRDWIAECGSAAPLNLVFANAGVACGEETDENVRKTFAVNVGGVVNTVLPALELFKKDAGGVRRQIAMVSSIAGYGPLAACPSYSASKAAVKTWGLSLRPGCARSGIGVSVICPGFVRSRITDANTCPMPFFMEADRAARRICDGILRNRALIAFPWPMRFGAWLLSALPHRIGLALASSLPEKAKGARAGSSREGV